MLETGLICARFLHYPALCSPEPRWSPAGSALHVASDGSLRLGYRDVSHRPPLAGYRRCQYAGTLSAALDPDSIRSVLTHTIFGWVWAARLTLSALLVLLTGFSFFFPKRHFGGVLITILSGALLATMAGAGHTMHSEGMERSVHIAADGAHLLAAGAWFGGLFALGKVLADRTPDTTPVLHRFSGMGYVAVAALVGSGLINSWYLVGSVVKLFATPYGQLLLVKLGLFSGMLLLAAANRFWLVPALTRDSGQVPIAEQRLRRHVVAEQALGVSVIIIVSLLGTLELAIGHS